MEHEWADFAARLGHRRTGAAARTRAAAVAAAAARDLLRHELRRERARARAFGARASRSAQCASTPRYARGKNRRTANQTLHAMISVMTTAWKIA